MKCVLVLSKYVTQTYYGHPVDHCTTSLFVSDELSPEEVERAKENLHRRMEAMPVKAFPVASPHGSLLAASLIND